MHTESNHYNSHASEYRSDRRRTAAAQGNRLTLIHPVTLLGILVVITLFGRLQRPPIFPINLTYLTFGLLSFFLILYSVHEKDKAHFNWTLPDRLVLFILYFSLLASLIAPIFYDLPINITSADLLSYIGVLILYFIARVSLQSTHQVNWLITIILVGFGVQFSFALLNYFSGSEAQLLRAVLSDRVLDNSEYAVTTDARITGFHLNANNFATFPTLAIPLLVARYTAKKNHALRRSHNFLLALALTFAVATLVFTFSRSAWVGVTVSVIILVSRSGALKNLKSLIPIILGILAVLALFTYVFYNVGQVELWNLVRQRGVSIIDEEASGGRPDMWRHSLYVATSHPTGTGLGNLRLASLRTISPYPHVSGRNVHNSILAVSLQSGVIAGISFLGLFLVQIIRGYRHTASNDGAVDWQVRGIASALLALFVHFSFHVVDSHAVIWVLLACQTVLLQKTIPITQSG